MILGNSRILRSVYTTAPPSFYLNNVCLEIVDEVKNLGIIIRNDLSWEAQINCICNKVYKTIYQLRRIAIDFPTKVRQQLVETLVFPFFDYATVAYCDLNGENINRLQKAQNAALRFALRLRLDQHVTPEFRRLGWLKIVEKKKLAIATMMFKLLKFNKPEYLYSKFIFMTSVHSIPTRNVGKRLQIPAHRTRTFERSFLVQGAKLFNDNHDLFNPSNRIETFRKQFKEILLKNYITES